MNNDVKPKHPPLFYETGLLYQEGVPGYAIGVNRNTPHTSPAERDDMLKKVALAYNMHDELVRLAEHLSQDPYALTPDQWASEARAVLAKLPKE